MRWIYLSPHLDDAVFSAGGLIHEQTQAGTPVEIWTIMCGFPPEGEPSPFAHSLHAKWGFSSAGETVHARRAEDRHAAEILGAGVVHFDFLDCIYRRGESGEWLYDDVFLSPHEEEARLPSRIAGEISARLTREDVLVCPLSLGSHIDHVLARRGAELLGHSLHYFIDIPYLFYQPHQLEAKSAGMRGSVESITEAGLRRWQEAALAYRSQFPVLGEAFDTPEKAREAIRSYWSERRGIRLLHFS